MRILPHTMRWQKSGRKNVPPVSGRWSISAARSAGMSAAIQKRRGFTHASRWIRGPSPWQCICCSHSFLSEETERPLALYMGGVVLAKCQEVWVFGSRISEGMEKEICKARRMHKAVRYFTEDLEEVPHED